MDDIEDRLRVRLERLAAAVPVRPSHEVVAEPVRPSAAFVRPPSATLLVAALLVGVVAIGVGVASRLVAPATSGQPSVTAPASPTSGSTSSVPSPSQQNPVVTCEGPATACARATRIVLDALGSVGHPATRITFRSDQLCIGAPYGGRPCGAPAWPVGTQRMTSAVVTFSGTDQQAFLNVFWLADGSIISAEVMALEAPPPGATPFP
jgi:hypothetical protein